MMDATNQPEAMTLCLVCDSPIVEAAVRVSCPPPHQIAMYSRQHLVNEQHALSAHGQTIVEAAAAADVVLIDWAFDEAPAINTLCYHVRRDTLTPVFTLSQGDQETQTASIAAGADDALAFPLYLPFLQAKVLAYHRLVQAARSSSFLRPAANQRNEAPPHEVHRFGMLRLDRTAHRFFIRDTEVELTPREFALLDFMIERAETLCTRDQILDRVWGINFDTGTNMVDVYMYFLRKKLEAYGLANMIKTVRGHGYRLVLPQPSPS